MRLRNTTAAFAICPLLAGVAACGSSSPALDPPAAVVDDVTTDTIRDDALRNAPQLPVTEAFRIDGNQGEELFTNIRSIEIADDRVYVADGLSSFVRVYDLAGSEVFRFGGKGDGPGELSNIFLLAVSHDTLYVVDDRGLNIFNTAGEYRTRGLINIVLLDNRGRVQVRSFPRTLDATAAGLIISKDLSPSVMSRTETVIHDSVWLHRLAPDGTLGPAVQAIALETRYSFGTNRAGRSAAHFSPEVRFAIMRDGRVLVTDGDGTTFDIYRDGTREHRVRFDVERRKVTGADLDSAFERRYAIWKRPLPANYSVPPDFAESLDRGNRALPHATLHPVVGRLLVSDDMILINRPDLGSSTFEWEVRPEPSVWTALNHDFEVVGSVELPGNFTPVIFRNDVVVGTIEDENDVPSIVGYRITFTDHPSERRS